MRSSDPFESIMDSTPILQTESIMDSQMIFQVDVNLQYPPIGPLSPLGRGLG